MKYEMNNIDINALKLRQLLTNVLKPKRLVLKIILAVLRRYAHATGREIFAAQCSFQFANYRKKCNIRIKINLFQNKTYSLAEIIIPYKTIL